MSTGSITVQRGDSPWRIAQQSLKQQNKTVDNKAIVAEMNRLAQVNGCKSVDEFGSKFFSSTGMEINIGQDPTEVAQSNTKKAKQSSAQKTQETKQADKTQKAMPKKTETTTPKTSQKVPENETIEQEVARINGMENDLTRIIQYNKKHYKGDHYGVVDKKTCQLVIYDKSGQIVKRISVGIGKTKGDGLSNYYMDHYNNTDKAYLAEQNRYTTPGEFTLDEIIVDSKTHTKGYTGTDGKYRVMEMKGDNRGVNSAQQAIHVVYNNDPDRIKGIKSAGVSDNRMSYGCVNLLQEDYDAMHELLGEGDKIFVLPEEKGNKLQLERQSDGSYIFHQQNHKSDERQYSVASVSKVNYDVRPDRDPKLIAKREEEEKQRQLAQQQEQKQTPNYAWYDPRGWIS